MYQKRNNDLAVISIYTNGYGMRFYLRQISKLSNLPLKTCQNVLINLEKEKIDAIVALGAVIQGQTYHDILIMNTIVPKLMDISLQYKKPLGMGIIGPRVTWKQAEQRAAEYAERAVKTAVEMAKIIKN